jgi:glycosyltransferase involved in cell wall biosynthesis
MVPDLVSVILPNRNHVHYLPHALAALRAQTWERLEVIIVDDASTDESCNFVERAAVDDERIKLVRLGSHVGVNAAIGRGLAVAQGEFLHFAASDDWIAPEFFERSVAVLRSTPSSPLCFSDPMENREQRRTFPLFLGDTPRVFSPDAMLSELRRNYFHISSNTILYRRKHFIEAGGLRPNLHWLADWFVNNLLVLRYGASYLPEALTCVTIRNDSYSAVNLRRRAAQRDLLLRVLDLLAQPDFVDVRWRFREAALLPEYKLRDLIWLMSSPAHREYLTVRLARRIVGRGIWNYFRPFAPVSLRQRIRRLSSART